MSSEINNSPAPEQSSEDRTDAGDGGPPLGTKRQQYVFVVLAVIAAVIAGVVFASLVFGGGEPDDELDGSVAVVKVEGPIAEPVGADLEDELREIRANESIDAVVLKFDTTGGAPDSAERGYMAIQRTSEEMPTLSYVQGVSASAGYYMMLPSEEIYMLPTSITGSVGVNAFAPEAFPPTEGPTGPDKVGSNPIQDWGQIDTLDSIFLDTVMEQRGDRIELSKEEVSTAQVFLGVDAVDNGFADEIGSLEDAIADAADRADLEEYDVVERSVGATLGLPIIAQTDHGIAVIHDANPTIADVELMHYGMVYEPAVPHIDELEDIASSDVEAIAAELAEADAEEQEGEEP